jgi:DNA-directed RNA polymerase specialized sigma24 family protein
VKNLPNDDKCKRDDFRSLFASAASELQWLCHTLTGNEDLTSRVLEAALEQSLKGADGVFREWMLSWARRLTVKVCITLVRPAVGDDYQHPYLLQTTTGLANSDQLDLALGQSSDVLQQKLLRLDALSRFVFVLRAVEGYSRRDTALLLDLDDRTCELVYLCAVRAIRPNVYVMKPVGTAMELVTA